MQSKEWVQQANSAGSAVMDGVLEHLCRKVGFTKVDRFTRYVLSIKNWQARRSSHFFLWPRGSAVCGRWDCELQLITV